MLTNIILKNFGSESILEVAPAFADAIAKRGEIKIFEKGKVIQEKGKPIHHFLIPISSEVQLFDGPHDGPRRTHIGYLKKYRILNLAQILRSEVSFYNVATEDDTTFLSIPVGTGLEALKTDPIVHQYLRLMTEFSGVRSLKHFCARLNLPPRKIVELIAMIPHETMNYRAGEKIEYHGQSLLMINRGEVMVRHDDRAEHARLEHETPGARLSEGAWFGGRTLVQRWDDSYEFTAVTDVSISSLDLGRARPLLDELKLVDTLASEAWLEKTKTSVDIWAGSGISDLPGEVLSPEQIANLNISINLTRLLKAKSDIHSFPSSVINFCIIGSYDCNRANIANDLLTGNRITPITIADSLEKYGLLCSPVKLPASELESAKLPALMVVGSRLCILLKSHNNVIILLDPCRGVVALRAADIAQHWDGSILEVRVSHFNGVPLEEKNESKGRAENGAQSKNDSPFVEEKRHLWHSLINSARPFTSAFKVKLVLYVLLILAGMAGPKLNQEIFDQIVTIRDLRGVTGLIFGIVVVSLINMALALLNGRIDAEVKTRVDFGIRSEIYRHILRLPQSSKMGKNVGVIQENFRQVSSVLGLMTEIPLTLGVQLATLVIYSVYLMLYDFKLMALGLALAPVSIGIRYLNKRLLKSLIQKAYDATIESNSLWNSVLSNIMSVKVAGAEELVRGKLIRVMLDGIQIQRHIDVQNSMSNAIAQLVSAVAQVAAIYLGAVLFLSKQISPGEMVAVSMYFSAFMGPVAAIAAFFQNFEESKLHFNLLEATARVPQEESKQEALNHYSRKIEGKIVIDNLSFKYGEDMPWILKDIKMSIFPKQVVAIVGPSGCGKTTLAKVLMGLEKHTSGRIFVDDLDSRFFSASSLRKQFSVVMQENELLSGSIAENVAYGDCAPDNARIVRALEDANAMKFVENIPGGMHYHLMEGGAGLSGGQRQRISIARSLYKDSAVLIFDEATSALDSESESGIFERLRSSFGTKTMIVIAHRLSTVRNCDHIFVMNDGAIVEEGTHSNLIKKQGFYFSLFKNQLVEAV